MSDLLAIHEIAKKNGKVKCFVLSSNTKRAATGANGWGEITIAVDNDTILNLDDYIGAIYLADKVEFSEAKENIRTRETENSNAHVFKKEDITLEQLDNMKHALGFNPDKVKYNKYEAYRNYYTTSNDDPGWDMLVKLGLASKSDFKNGVGDNPKCYYVTQAGMDLVGEICRCKITEGR